MSDKRHKMVGWYDPGQLARTGYEVMLSTIFGRHADKRIMHAIADDGGLRPRYFYEFKATADDLWFDYISDVGDGFDSTYTVAYHATTANLNLQTRGENSQNHPTKCGEILILGGDEVYPTASRTEYAERLTHPYNCARPKKTDPQLRELPNHKFPALFAIPGNHDWYDSLVSFMSLFGRGKRWCGWRTYQNRSYFALKLPHGWWVFGTDMQLGSSLDDAQVDYFETIVRDHFEPSDRIILCNAEPHWITAKMYEGNPAYDNRNLDYFLGQPLKHRVAIHIAGDRHYYRRHEEVSNGNEQVDPKSRSKVQKFVAGGGGAFLHPTHREGVGTVGKRHVFELKESYPSEKVSFWLTFWNIAFPLWNLKFGFVTAVLYVLTAQAFTADLSGFGPGDHIRAGATVFKGFLYEPVATYWVAITFFAFYFFTDAHRAVPRWILWPLHAVAHLMAVFALGWAAAYWYSGYGWFASAILSMITVAVGGYLFGSIIMGIYLFLSLNVFGVHHNEAFSSIKIEDYKNFLRMRIDRDGTLTVFPVGIDKAIHDWTEVPNPRGNTKLIPTVNVGSVPYRPFLIEDPISFEKPTASGAAPTPAQGVDRSTFVERPLDQ